MICEPLNAGASNMRALWKQTQGRLRELISEEEYNDWFENVHIEEIRDETVIFGIPSGYRRDYIEENYQSLLGSIISSLLGEPIRAEILLSDTPVEEWNEPEGRTAIHTETDTPLELEPLNEHYTFTSYVVGASNKIAHAAAEAIAQESSIKPYNNPFFLYGGVGLGKTHLMQAIGNEVLKLHTGKRVAYLSAEQFVNLFIDAIKRNDRLSFQATFRNVDVLLVDDIQFLEGKESTLEEFFHTFNALHNRRKQIVISSDRPPKDIRSIQDRLRSRFEWGLIVDIEPPEFEHRMAILRQKCENINADVPDEVLEFIANRIRSSVRELEGALSKIMAHTHIAEERVDVETAGKLLGEFSDHSQKDVTIERIQRKVADYFNIKTADIMGSSRSRSIAKPRQIAMYLSRKLTRHSFPEIGTFFGNKDHTTIMFAHKKISKEMETDTDLRAMIQRLTDSVAY